MLDKEIDAIEARIDTHTDVIVKNLVMRALLLIDVEFIGCLDYTFIAIDARIEMAEYHIVQLRQELLCR